MNKKDVTVIIPAYNEEKTIAKIAEEVNAALSKKYPFLEILVMDDKSTDHTAQQVVALQKKLPNVRLITNKKNQGKTKTVLRGFSLTSAPILAFIDADFQYFPKDLPKVISKVQEGYDICSGYRVNRHDALHRKVLSWGFNLVNRLLFNIRVRDVNCGLKAFNRESFKKIKLRYVTGPWFIDTEMLARAVELNLKIAEVPINHDYRREGKSRINMFSIVFETLGHAILLKLELLFGRRR